MKVKGIIMIVLLSIFPIFISGSSFAFPNEPDGFRGIKWGTPLSKCKGMKPNGREIVLAMVGRKGEYSQFRNHNDWGLVTSSYFL